MALMMDRMVLISSGTTMDMITYTTPATSASTSAMATGRRARLRRGVRSMKNRTRRSRKRMGTLSTKASTPPRKKGIRMPQRLTISPVSELPRSKRK